MAEDQVLASAIERAEIKQAHDIKHEAHTREHQLIETHWLSLVAAEHDARLIAEEAVEKARQIQFNEYERRLDNLNHAHQQAVEAAAKTVPREMFEASQSAMEAKYDVALSDLNKTADSLSNWRSGVEGRIIGISAAIGIAVIVINLGLRLVLGH